MHMPQRSEFLAIEPLVIGQKATVTQRLHIAKAEAETAIRIHDIDMASRRLVADYPKLAGWFCLSVKNRREFAVEKCLGESDVEACVPRRKGDVIRKRGRELPPPTLPVIPGYLLVKCVPSPSAFSGLRNVDNVTGIIGRGEVPYRVPVKFIEPFMALAAEGKYDYHPEEHGYEVYMQVRITDGPFASFPAVVTNIDKAATEGRINVEASIFGRSTPIELDLAQIEKL